MKLETCIRCNGSGSKVTGALITGDPKLRRNYVQLTCDWCDGKGTVCSTCHGTKSLAAIKLDWLGSSAISCPDCK